MPLPLNTPSSIIETIAGYTQGSYERPELQKRIDDLIKADASLKPFKEAHLQWVYADGDDTADFLDGGPF